MLLCGSRFGRGALRPGGVVMRLSSELAREVAANIALLQNDLEPINELFLSARTVQHRLRGVGTLTTAQATELGVVGLAARASGVPTDVRRLTRTGVYQLLRIHSAVLMDGDCWSRARLRIEELDASLVWIAAVLERYADWQQPLRPLDGLAPQQLAIAIVEGIRAEVVHCLETCAQGELSH